jgi:transcriptional regulator with XRE-family HTH domain
MNGQISAGPTELASKIARLAEECGWNQEDFARNTGLNRQTIRQILQSTGERRLRNGTISRCARALGFSVNELRSLPLERLLPRQILRTTTAGDEQTQRLYEQATQPELQAWLERNPQRARELLPEEIDELLSLQGTGGPLTRIGVEHYIDLIERKRRLIQQVQAIAGTEYLDLLEQMVALIHEKVQPYKDRV